MHGWKFLSDDLPDENLGKVLLWKSGLDWPVIADVEVLRFAMQRFPEMHVGYFWIQFPQPPSSYEEAEENSD